MATFQITAPTSFDFRRPEDWPKWIRRFDRFRMASGLVEKDAPVQVNALIYAMGDEADDILASFGLTAGEKAHYDTVRTRFQQYFVASRNVIYERAKFNSRIQGEDEPVDRFITALYGLVEHCNYGALTDDMLRDRIVVGIRDDRLSEKLQLDPDLTLAKATQLTRQSEQVKKQQPSLRSNFQATETPQAEVEAVSKKPSYAQGKGKSASSSKPSGQQPQSDSCRWCGRRPSHRRSACPAKILHV